MANFFPKWVNAIAWKTAIMVIILTSLISVGMAYYFTPKYTRVGYQPDQPVPFSHQLHVGELGMDCRYCHSFVEVASHSNLPSSQTCMACHTQVKPDSPKLDAVRAAWNKGAGDGPPVNWVQIHRLPGYTYFNHAAHVNRGVSCFSCHGNVNNMPVVYQHEPQSMSWCLDCHRAPEKFLRPQAEVFNLDWKAGSRAEQLRLGAQFKHEWDVNPPVTCGGCHR